MLFWILVAFQIITSIVAGEASIRKTPQGASTLQTLSKAGFFFLQWRAYANYKKELLILQKLFGALAVLFSVMFFVLGTTVTNTSFAILPGVFIFLWMTMQFGTNFKESINNPLSIIAIMVIAPWAFYLLNFFTDFQFQQIRTIAKPLETFVNLQLSDLSLTFFLSLLGLIGGTIMAAFIVLTFSIVPLFILFLIVVSSTISRKLLKTSPTTAYNIAMGYYCLVGPILIALETKGII